MIQNETLIVTLNLGQLKQLIKDAVEEAKEDKPKSESLLSPEEARKVWQPAISKVTLHRWTKEGLVPVHRIGGRVYYKHSELINSVKEIRPYDHRKAYKPEVILPLDRLPELCEKHKDKK